MVPGVRWLPKSLNATPVPQDWYVPELHVLSEPVTVNRDTFVQCSCGHVEETFGVALTECPVADIWIDYEATIRDAVRIRDLWLARRRERSQDSARRLGYGARG